jgi:hypothetical protein
VIATSLNTGQDGFKAMVMVLATAYKAKSQLQLPNSVQPCGNGDTTSNRLPKNSGICITVSILGNLGNECDGYRSGPPTQKSI